MLKALTKTLGGFGLFGDNPHLRGLARRYFGSALLVTLLAMLAGLLEGAGVGLLIPLLSTFTADLGGGKGDPLRFIEHLAAGHTRNQRLIIVTSLILACMVAKNALQVIGNRLSSWVDGRVGHDIRCALAKSLHKTAYSFFTAEDPARLLDILSSESWRASEALRVVLTRLAEAAAVAVFTVLLILVNWKLTLLVLIGGSLTRFIQKRGERHIRARSAIAVTANQELADRMLFTIFGARLVRLFHSQTKEQTLFAEASDDLRRANLRLETMSVSLGPTLEMLHSFLFVVILLLSVFSGVPLPVLAAFLVLMNRLQPHLRGLEQSGVALAAAGATFREVEWLLNPTNRPLAPIGRLPFDHVRGEIAFEGVSFGYPSRNEQALTEASFVLPRGRSTALIGSSGAGKSTVVSLICRLYEPTRGNILVDGTPLNQLRTADWLNKVAIAGQDVELIDGTIAENICYNRPDVKSIDIDASIRQAGAAFVYELPLGVDTIVGPNGQNLSGGQRQRIGIARALARKPDLLIFDEATNAVDLETESGILETLKQLPSQTTLLVISHRRSTLAFCDSGVVLEKGRVVQWGPMTELSAYLGEASLEQSQSETASDQKVS